MCSQPAVQERARVALGAFVGATLARVPRAGIIGASSMMQVAVGKDVEAACRKCGEVWHVIVAVEGGKITKVQCKECMAYHRYRPPEGEERVDAEQKPKKVVAARKPSSPRKSTGSAAKGPGKKAVAHDEPLVEPDLSRPIRIYKMTDAYAPGDRVEHPKFGQGVVELLSGPGKMTVFFEDGRRVLAHHR
jgi:transcription elongation factor Elf1